MSNHLKVAMIDLILSLHRKGWSQRRIASELGSQPRDRRTLPQAGRAAPKPAIAPPGSDRGRAEPKPAIAPPGSDSPRRRAPMRSSRRPVGPATVGSASRGRPSECEPWRDIIQSKFDQGLSAQRIYQDLIAEHGFRGATTPSVALFAASTRPELPFRRLECEPGEEAQVDFGTGAGFHTRRQAPQEPISSASCCRTHARPTARPSTARPPTSSSAASRTPSATSAERRDAWSWTTSRPP